MKTLKKSLALVLAVVMVVGVLAVSASAATFTDSDKVQYTEAVEVLSAIKVIDGIGDGSFAPTATLTREQGAAIVTRMLLTRSVANALGATSATFSDVPANWWSAGVVGYAAQQNIVAGIGDGTFAPTATLTGAQFAKMLLVAIGVDGTYTGDAWFNNVIVAATKAKLANGISGFDYTKGITREEACQMALNALFYTETGAVTEKIYGITGWEKQTVSGTETLVPVYGWISVENPGTDSIANTVFKLTYSTSGEAGKDAFGRPAKTYYQDDKKIATFATSPVLTYEGKGTTVGSIYNALGLKEKTEATVTVDGVAQTGVNLTASDKTAVGGNGVVTEVYKTGSTYAIIEIQSHFGTVKSVKTEKNAETGVSTTVLTLNNTLTTDKFVDFAKKTAVIYTVAGDEIQSMEAADTISGTLTKAVNSKDYTIGGTVYQVSKTSDLTSDKIVGASNVNMGKTATYYVDSYGYLMAEVGASVNENAGTYIKVLASDNITVGGNYLSGGDNIGKVYGILSDGSYGEYTVNYATGTTKLAAGIYEYTVNKNGELVIESSATVATTTASATPSSTNPVLAGIVLNSNTTFIYATQNGEKDLTIKTIEVKKGVANSGVIASGAQVVSENGIAVVVFVGATYTEGTTVSDVAYVDISTEKSTTTVEIGENGQTKTVTVNAYTAYTADGEELTLTSESKITASGVYNYNDDDTIGSAASTVNGALKVFGSTLQVGNVYYSYNPDNVCFLKDDTALLNGQTVVAIANDKGVLTHIWVVADTTED